MKHVALIFSMIMLAAFSSRGQSYQSWFSRDGVSFYYESYQSTSGTDKHLKLKVENRNPYKVEVSWSGLEWTKAGSVVGHESGQMFDIRAGGEQHGDYAGLWFYAPQGYQLSELQYKLEGLRIKRED